MPSESHTPAITLLLRRWQDGETTAFDELTVYVYKDLHRRAAAYLRNERPAHTFEPTDLVHEAFIKLVDKNEITWADRNHFFAVAAQTMRRILVDHARGRNREKRGGEAETIRLDQAGQVGFSEPKIDHIALDEALNELASFDERQTRIVELKYFGGMTLDETADVLGISRETVKRDWQLARAWLRQRLT